MKVESYKTKALVEMMRYDGTLKCAVAVCEWSSGAAFPKKIGTDGDVKLWALVVQAEPNVTEVATCDYIVRSTDGDFYMMPARDLRRLYVVPEPKAKKASK